MTVLRNPRSATALASAAFLLFGCDDGNPDRDTDVTPDVADTSSDTADIGVDTTADVLDDVVAVDVPTDPISDADADADAPPGPDADTTSSATCTTSAPTGFTPHDVNGWSVAIDEGNGRWTVTPAGTAEPTLVAPPTCREDGTATVRAALGAPHVINEFGAFRITLEGGRSTLEWASAVGPPTVTTEEDALVLSYILGEASAPLSVRFSEDGSNLRIEMEGAFDAGELTWTTHEDEAFFGLGTQVTGMNLRGRTYPLWTQEQGNGKPENPLAFPLQNAPEAAYAPMGVWWSSRGATSLITHDAYSEIDLGHSRDDEAALRSYAALPGFILLSGESPRERMRTLTSYTGRLPYDPPAWTFGPWNDSVGGGERLREVATTLRSADIPSSAIWSEDWIGGSQTGTGYRLSYAWEWSEETYPDLPEDIAWLQARGFAFLAYFNTFVPQPTRMWTEGVEGGFLMTDADGEVRTVQDPAFRTAGLVDLSNPDAAAWMRGYLDTAATTLGIDGWMADFTEWAPVDAVLGGGDDPWHFHNRYPLEFQELTTAALRDAHADEEDPSNWTYWARSGWASANGGSGGIVPTMWGGDQNTNWDYDDGFPTVIPIATHVGLSGVPIFGSDIAGYNALFGNATTKELFLRWSALGAFHPLMRTHHGSNECANWSFDRDEETLQHYRRYARLHTQLYPLFRDLTDEARTNGMPITRHPYLVAPDAAPMWEGDDFLFFIGDDLLVAPVIAEDATTRDVELPGEGWWPLFGASPVAGSVDDDGVVRATVDADYTEIPVFVRPGSALVLLETAPDTFYDVTVAEVTTLDDVDLALVLYPDGDGAVPAQTRFGVQVSASGWSTSDTGVPTWNGTPLDACDGGDPPCLDNGTIRVSGAGELARDGGTVAINTGDEARVVALVANTALEAATPTPLTDLTPDIPPPCDEE